MSSQSTGPVTRYSPETSSSLPAITYQLINYMPYGTVIFGIKYSGPSYRSCSCLHTVRPCSETKRNRHVPVSHRLISNDHEEKLISHNEMLENSFSCLFPSDCKTVSSSLVSRSLRSSVPSIRRAQLHDCTELDQCQSRDHDSANKH